MTAAEVVLAVVVLLAGFPAAWKNPTAAGLVVAWIVVTLLWYKVPGGQAFLSDRVAEPTLLLGLDAMVLTIIFAKPPRYDCLPYRGWRHQLRCIVLEKSVWDRRIMACFPAIWVAYLLPHQSFRWWMLWILAMAQLLAAIAEPLQNYRERRAANAGRAEPDNPSSGAEFWALTRVRGHA